MPGFAKLVLGAIAANFVSFAQAELVSHGLTTVDTVSGLEWLDLSETTGKSFDQVTGQFGAGGLYEGYRYASAAEAQDVFRQVGFPVTHYVVTANYQYQSALDQFKSLFGLNFGIPSAPTGFVGQVGDAILGYPGMHFLYYAFPSSINTDVPLTGLIAAGEQLVSTTYEVTVGLASDSTLYGPGSFLVRPADILAVPEPSTWALMFLGGMAVVSWRRRC